MAACISGAKSFSSIRRMVRLKWRAAIPGLGPKP
jgi:hypothetical protein